MRTLLKISALSFLVILTIGCKKDPAKNPSEGGKHPEPEEYAGWNTSGEFVVPKKDATLNPNYFQTVDSEIEVLASDFEKGTATIRFKNEIPKLYKGAILLFRPSQDMGHILAYIQTVSGEGRDKSITYRQAGINEIFFNREITFTTNPDDTEDVNGELCILQAENQTKDYDGGFVKFQKTIEMFDPSVVEANFTSDAKLYPKLTYDFKEPMVDEVNCVCVAEQNTASLLLKGSMSIEADLGLKFHLNLDKDLFEKKSPSYNLGGSSFMGVVGGVFVEFSIRPSICGKYNLGASGTATITSHASFSMDVTLGEKYYNGEFIPVHQAVTKKSFDLDPINVEECDAEFKVGPSISTKFLAYEVIGANVEMFEYLSGSVTGSAGKYNDKGYIGFEGKVGFGIELDASITVLDPFRWDYLNVVKWPSHDPMLFFDIYKYPNKVEPKDENLDLELSYNQKLKGKSSTEPKMNVTDLNISKVNQKSPSKKALVKVEVLSNMPEGTPGTFRNKDGKTCHSIVYDITDENGEIPVDFTVPGPMQYDFTFKTSVIGADGEEDEVDVCKLYPLNRFKCYTATYTASDCTGSTTIDVSDYGKTVKEKGRFERRMVIDGGTIVATYNVDSDFEEMAEIEDVTISDGVAYVTMNMKYYAGQCIIDPVLERLDYKRWDQDMNGKYEGFDYTDCTEHGLDGCVHAIGPEISYFFPKTDIIYWENIPVKVATGYLDPECTKFSYLTLQSHMIIDDGSEDRKMKDGDTDYTPRDPYTGDPDDDGPGGGTPGWGGGFPNWPVNPDPGDDEDDHKDDKGYYVRVTEELNDWEGTYLIICHHDNPTGKDSYDCLRGDMNSLSGVQNGRAVLVDEYYDRIKSEPTLDAMNFTIKKLSSGGYSIRAHSGVYIGSPDSEGIACSSSAITNYIKYDDYLNGAQIQGTQNNTLCWDGKCGYFQFVPWKKYDEGINLYTVDLYKLY